MKLPVYFWTSTFRCLQVAEAVAQFAASDYDGAERRRALGNGNNGRGCQGTDTGSYFLLNRFTLKHIFEYLYHIRKKTRVNELDIFFTKVNWLREKETLKANSLWLIRLAKGRFYFYADLSFQSTVKLLHLSSNIVINISYDAMCASIYPIVFQIFFS